MELKINGEQRDFDFTAITLRNLLERIDMPVEKGVAVAVNDDVIPRSRWGEHQLHDGDRLEIIRATQGG